MAQILVVVPARGGSKGIPRKNLRPMGGHPLISYAIRTARRSRHCPEVYVTTDDPEIAEIAKLYGAKVVRREGRLAGDAVTLDPVVHDAVLKVESRQGEMFDLVVTLQPTSPLLKIESLDSAIDRMLNDDAIDTIIAAVEERHLTWRVEEGRILPNYRERVNRQFMTPTFKETGGFLISRRSTVTDSGRIGGNVSLHVLHGAEGVDIDDLADWSVCEAELQRRQILFVVSGNRTIGMGHVYNTLLVANDLVRHSVSFLVERGSDLALEKLVRSNYVVRAQQGENLIEDVSAVLPDIVINDCLDTSEEYILALKELGISVINFEDLGPGAQHADLVINAIYPERLVSPRHFFGHRYFILRDEFLLTTPSSVRPEVGSVLVTFGGVDPSDLTRRVLKAIHSYCEKRSIKITVVCGLGYRSADALLAFGGVEVLSDCATMASFMAHADIVFTSAGRTIYEAAAMKVPTIVMCQNRREQTHLFASAENGFVNLGMGAEVSEETLLSAFVRLVQNFEERQHMHQLMSAHDLAGGRRRVLKLIEEVCSRT